MKALPSESASTLSSKLSFVAIIFAFKLILLIVVGSIFLEAGSDIV